MDFFKTKGLTIRTPEKIVQLGASTNQMDEVKSEAETCETDEDEKRCDGQLGGEAGAALATESTPSRKEKKWNSRKAKTSP